MGILLSKLGGSKTKSRTAKAAARKEIVKYSKETEAETEDMEASYCIITEKDVQDIKDKREVDEIYSQREQISRLEEEIDKLNAKIASSRSKQAEERYKKQKRQREGQLSNLNILLRQRETATLRGTLKHAMVGIQQATNNISDDRSENTADSESL